VKAHTLGEVGILGIVLRSISSGTILAIFIEISSYLTEKEQKKDGTVFLRHGVVTMQLAFLQSNSNSHLIGNFAS